MSLSDPDVSGRSRRVASSVEAVQGPHPGRRMPACPSRAFGRRAGGARTARRRLGDRQADVARRSLSEAEADLADLEEQLRLLMLPKDPNDGKAVIMEIRGAEGGEEANLFAGDLYEMYRGFAALKGWNGRGAVARRQRPRRDQPGHHPDQRRHGVEPPEVRGRHAPRAARARHREPGTHPHLVGDGAGAARGRGGRGRDRRARPRDRRLPRQRARRPGRQHHRLGGAHHPQADRAWSSRCRTSAASCRTGRGRCRCCAPGC